MTAIKTNPNRRTLLKIVSLAAASAPLVALSIRAKATTNPEVRARLQYQDIPKDSMMCSNCLEFRPGKTDHDLGSCNKIPGDNEISPNGYCTAWNTM
ncbi:MAG: high-potential iron-sulfur protein [Thiobacillaceae bacterium]